MAVAHLRKPFRLLSRPPEGELLACPTDDSFGLVRSAEQGQSHPHASAASQSAFAGPPPACRKPTPALDTRPASQAGPLTCRLFCEGVPTVRGPIGAARGQQERIDYSLMRVPSPAWTDGPGHHCLRNRSSPSAKIRSSFVPNSSARSSVLRVSPRQASFAGSSGISLKASKIARL